MANDLLPSPQDGGGGTPTLQEPTCEQEREALMSNSTWPRRPKRVALVALSVVVLGVVIAVAVSLSETSQEQSLQNSDNQTILDKGEQQRRPNLVFIMTDQQTFHALGLAGNPVLKTPNMDRIGREGVYFENAYSQCPVCGPARASLLCGLSIENTKVRNNNDASQNVSHCKSYDSILVDDGYVAEYYGKWHSPPGIREHVYQNELPERYVTPYREFLSSQNYTEPELEELQPGFQIQTLNQMPYATNPLDSRFLSPNGTFTNPDGSSVKQPDHHGISILPADLTITAYQGREALEALTRLARDIVQPFSLTVSLQSPHSPITPSEPYASQYAPQDMILPPSLKDPMTDSPYINANGRRRLPQYSDPDKIKYMIANYYAFVAELDVWVGKLLDQMDALGVSDSTLLVFTSDHGEMLGAHGMREKNIFLEESVHVPLLIRFPGRIQAETVVRQPIAHIDLFATILDYMGMPKQPSDGTSLRPIIEDPVSSPETYAISEWNYRGPGQKPGLMIRTLRWKLFLPTTVESSVLNAMYDLENDPYEMTNLLSVKNRTDFYLEQAEELRILMLEWLTKVGSPAFEGVQNRIL